MGDRKLELRIGFLVLAGIGVVAASLAILERRLFSPTYAVKATFSNAAGVSEGTPVLMGGVEIGRVESIQTPSAPERQVTLALAIQKQVTLKVDSLCSIEPRGLIGEKILEVGFGTPASAELSRDGSGRLSGTVPPSMTDLQNSVQNAAVLLQEALKKFNDLFGEGEVAAGIKSTVKNAAEMTEKGKLFMEDARGVAAKAQAMLDEARTAAQKFTVAVENFDARTGDVAVQARTMAKTLDEAVREQNAQMLDLQKDLKESVAKVNGVLDHADSIMSGIDRGEGTFGAFVRSDEFYQRTRELIQNLSKAAESIAKTSDFLRKHPSSVLWGGGADEEEEKPGEPKRPMPPEPPDQNRGRR